MSELRRFSMWSRDPLQCVQWVVRDLRLARAGGGPQEHLREVELPAEWSSGAARALLRNGGGECASVRVWVRRICETVEREEMRRGLRATSADGARFGTELAGLLLSQGAAVWAPALWTEQGAKRGSEPAAYGMLRLSRFLDVRGRVDVDGLRAAVGLVCRVLAVNETLEREGAEARVDAGGFAGRRPRVSAADLGALLMAGGVAYDSDRGRRVAVAVAGVITAELTLRRVWRARERKEASVNEETTRLSVAEQARRRRAELEHAMHAERESRGMRLIRAEAEQSAAAHPGTELERQTGELLQAAWAVWDNIERRAKRGEVRELVLLQSPSCAWAEEALDCDSSGLLPLQSLAREERRRCCGERRSQSRVGRAVAAGLQWLGYQGAELGEMLREVESTGVVPEQRLRVEHRGVFARHEAAGDAARRMQAAVRVFVEEPEAKRGERVEAETPWRTEVSATAVLDQERRRELCAGVEAGFAGRVDERTSAAGSVEDAVASDLLRDHAALLEVQLLSRASGLPVSEHGGVPQVMREPRVEGETPGVQPAGGEGTRAMGSEAVTPAGSARTMPEERQAVTYSFRAGGRETVVTVGLFADGTPGEIHVRMPREGSVIQEVLEAFSAVTSLALQHGVPLRELAERTEIASVGDAESTAIHEARPMVDYLFRWMEQRFARPGLSR